MARSVSGEMGVGVSMGVRVRVRVVLGVLVGVVAVRVGVVRVSMGSMGVDWGRDWGKRLLLRHLTCKDQFDISGVDWGSKGRGSGSSESENEESGGGVHDRKFEISDVVVKLGRATEE